MLGRKRSARDVALLIVNEFLERAKGFVRRTKGFEHIFIPTLETLREVIEAEKVEWDNVLHIVAAIMNSFLISFLYDCMSDEEANTCRDALYEWLEVQRGTSFEWMARRVVKELNLPINI